MEPIINPMLIYMIELADNLKLIGILFSAVTSVAFGTYCIETASDYLDAEEKAKRSKLISTVLKTIAISLIIALTMLSTSTSYKMLAASYVTTDSVNVAGHGAKEVVDYIFEKVNEMHSGNK